MMNTVNKELILTVAGSDSGGGAGIQVDLRTFKQFSCFGASVITAVTAQNPREVCGIYPMSAEAVGRQFSALDSEFDFSAAKTGMLFNSEIIDLTADFFMKHGNIKLTVDPVMVSTSGAVLFEDSAVESMKKNLLNCAFLVTPNIPEAELLSDMKIESLDDMKRSTEYISEKWNCFCLLKGGHFAASDECSDVLCCDEGNYLISSPMLELKNEFAAHGTGCTLSAAVSAKFATDLSVIDAVVSAKAFVYGSLKEAVCINDKLDAMYPPENDYIEEITVKRMK